MKFKIDFTSLGSDIEAVTGNNGNEIWIFYYHNFIQLKTTLFWTIAFCLFSWRYNPVWLYFHSPVAGFSLLVFEDLLITHNDAPQSVGLLWTSDQSVAETSTLQHTTLTTDKHPCPRWDSNPQFQHGSGRRRTPQTARPLGPALLDYYAKKSSDSLPTFRDNLSFPSSKLKKNLGFLTLEDRTYRLYRNAGKELRLIAAS